MKIISWNVNGIRACIKKGFEGFVLQSGADVVCVQETKAEASQVDINLSGQYSGFWNSAERKGYSGTAVFSKIEPVSVMYGIGEEEHDNEGRVITLKYGLAGEFIYLVNVYTPNAGQELARLDYRMRWEDAFRQYVCKLGSEAPVVICGDLNVAHREIDLANPKTNEHSPGYTKQERGKFGDLLDAGFTDTYRHFHPDRAGAYTWWPYMKGLRERNIGWRIDYFLCSDRITGLLQDAFIMPQVHGSDHCPVGIELRVES